MHFSIAMGVKSVGQKLQGYMWRHVSANNITASVTDIAGAAPFFVGEENN